MTESMPAFTLRPGTIPLLVSMPHVASHIPAHLQEVYTQRALNCEDTDWHLERLYAFASTMGASILIPSVSRYVIDLNRPPLDAPMYPGQNNTGLCPTTFFTGEALYRAGCEPRDEDKAQRIATYWQPYHAALQMELSRIRDLHGYALLWDAHSIRSTLPWLFPGKLPDLNLGSANGQSCDADLMQAVAQAAQVFSAYSLAVNGRFKGGHITRQYGMPAEHIHAIQLEMCWSTYMQEDSPYAYLPDVAVLIQPALQGMLEAFLEAARRKYG